MTDIIEKHLDFVKEQIQIQEKLAEKFGNKEYRKNLHLGSAKKFSDLYDDLLTLQKQLDGSSGSAPLDSPQIELNYEDVEGLPEELLQELSFSESDKLDFKIQKIIDENGGMASLDKIIVALYKETGEIHKRTSMTSKLYRMAQKDAVFSVPGRKGVYSTKPVTTSKEPSEQKREEAIDQEEFYE
ncbi:hypothetical protein NLU14_06680 [Marinobacter sp. 71-i]|uniref:Uncharacterized protein n=1 Tax=Marinobacter iranensis TaxID=2962607 RepID=A0ABT5Y8A4_9GAMM|nr:hypothetical protein [Marinobacter iranensis]MDF0749911.1 hypothetical protein [Marinobacter iranensis]